jgi:hypothetical protein
MVLLLSMGKKHSFSRKVCRYSVTGGRFLASKESYRVSSYLPKTRRFLQYVLPGTKEGGGPQTHSEFKTFSTGELLSRLSMESLANFIHSVNEGEWLASIDLMDAYLHVPIHPLLRKWLRFAIQGTSYQWRVLPFGLFPAPLVFTKTLFIR